MPRAAWILLVVLAVVAAIVTAFVAPPLDARETRNMSLPQAALLGAVEGLTEFLPVSSTGHLLVTQRALGVGADDATSREAAKAFAICIQLGAILAVLSLYLGRVRQMLRGLVGRDHDGGRLLVNVCAAFAPAAVVGLLFGDAIKEHLFGPWPVVLAWALGGGAILGVAWLRHEATPEGRAGLALESLTWKLALLIGLAQCLAVWPGVSRSLITIVGGVLAGLSLAAAVEFSFLLGLLTLGAATGYDALRHGAALTTTYSPPALLVGLVFAFVSAVLAVPWLVRYLQVHGLAVFGWYRLAIAGIVAVLLSCGVL